MKEKFKTILLFLLVGTSLAMTQQLWMQFPERVTGFFKPEISYSSSYLLSDMIAPNKYLVGIGGNNYTMVYDANKYGIWDTSKESLAGLLRSDTIRIEESETGYSPGQAVGMTVVFYFPESISTYILAKAWNVNEPNEIVDTIPYVDRISIVKGSGDPFFVFSDEERDVLVYDSGVAVDELQSNILDFEDSADFDYYYSLSEIFPTDVGDIYVPYEIRHSLPVVYVSNDVAQMTSGEMGILAERFLEREIDYIRQIVESNGSTIYIYNNKVLKFNMNGTVEYFHSLEDTIQERNLYLSLSTAAEFISQKAYSAKGMYLAGIDKIEAEGSLGYSLTFRYRVRGIPVLLGNREVQEYVQIEVFNNQVRSYRQLFRGEMDLDIASLQDSRQIMSSFDVIDKNYLFLESEYLEHTGETREQLGDQVVQRVLSSVEDITISYYDPGLKDQEERLIGVWIIRAHGSVYAFNAYSGMLVYER
jgi:regulatory protein YycH of two-component signal transduction system YycFG